MAKWTIPIISMLLIPIVMAIVNCDFSEDNLTNWQNVSYLEEAYNEAGEYFLEQSRTYYFRCRNDTGSYSYIKQRTKEGADTAMTSLGVVGFLIIFNLALFYLPFKVRFAVKDWANSVIQKLIWVAALAVLALNTTILITLADGAELGINSELFLFHWIFTKAIYIFMVLIFLNIVTKTPEMWKLEKIKQRSGDE